MPMSTARLNNLLGALVLSLHDDLRRDIEQRLGMQGAAGAAIVTIGNSPDRSVEWLSHALLLTHSGTVRLVDKLAADGLVERRDASHDARAVSLRLTASGERRMRAILEARRAVLERALDALGTADLKKLCDLVERMLGAITEVPRGDAMCRLCEESVCPQDRCPVTRQCAES